MGAEVLVWAVAGGLLLVIGIRAAVLIARVIAVRDDRDDERPGRHRGRATRR
jgi:hypothetical protein